MLLNCDLEPEIRRRDVRGEGTCTDSIPLRGRRPNVPGGPGTGNRRFGNAGTRREVAAAPAARSLPVSISQSRASGARVGADRGAALVSRAMSLAPLDWGILVLYFLISLGIGLYFTRRASGSTAEFFVSGRNLPWWLAGLQHAAHARKALIGDAAQPPRLAS